MSLVLTLFLVSFGIWILLSWEDILTRKKEISLFILTCLVLLVVAEAVSYIIIPPKPISRYGWQPEANSEVNWNMPHINGTKKRVLIKYYDYGFKRWGDINSNKSKILVIGDSFTEMFYVSNGQEYYSYLEKAFPGYEFFVYGASGYGTLQEYMVLNDTFDLIKPDIILWQFCGNDFINNLHSYESKVFLNNNRVYRPYFENGNIIYKKPRPLWWLRKYSRFFAFVLEKYDNIFFEKNVIAEREGKIKSYYPEEQKKSLKITEEIFRLVKDKTLNTPILLFEACFNTLEYNTLCSDFNLTCDYGLREHLQNKEKEGYYLTTVFDGHWNEAGNKLVGEYLVNYLKNNTFLIR